MAGLTKELGCFIAGLNLALIPSRAQDIAKTGIADCVGVMVAGAADPASAIVDRLFKSADRPTLASLIPAGGARNLEHAALVNGIAAHILDYDDVALGGHPSAVLVPAILATSEACNTNGSDMLTAYVAGYEVWAELLLREPAPLHQKGWHTTAVRGTVAAAAACARLRRLSSEQCATAIAIAASMSAGLVANFGSMTKSLHVGRAAQSGVMAAMLAEAGFTASADAIEHPSGFLTAFSPRGDADHDRPLVSHSREWQIVHRGLNIKRYPICYATHRAIDATLDLAGKHHLQAKDVTGIHVLTGQTQMLMVRNHNPLTSLEAKFSMEFALASALTARKVGFAELTDSFVQNSAVREIFSRVTYETTPETMEGSALAPSDTVKITTTDGTCLSSGAIAYAKGSFQHPMSNDELWTKFADCVGESYSAGRKSNLFEKLMSLEQQKTFADLGLLSS